MTMPSITDIDPWAKSATASLIVLSIIGIFGNSNIVWATYRKPSLRSTCGIFVSISAFGDCAQQSAYGILGYIVFKETNFTGLTCYTLQVGPTFGCSLSSVMLLMTSIDRLICVSNPRFYEDLNKRLVLFVGITIAISISLFFSIYAYIVRDSLPRLCGPLADIPAHAIKYYYLFNFVNIILTLTMYCIIWAVVRRKKYKKSRSMLRTITAISLCICSGWLATTLLGAIQARPNSDFSFSRALATGSLMNVSIALNYPLLFLMSREYKAAFTEQLRLLSCDRRWRAAPTTDSTIISVRSRQKGSYISSAVITSALPYPNTVSRHIGDCDNLYSLRP